MTEAAQSLIQRHKLQPHPEGGFYRETYRSEMRVETSAGDRSAGTAILYMLCGDDVSRFHRIDADEMWHHYEGGDLEIYSLQPDGATRVDVLGRDNLQVVIKAGVWFGAALSHADDHSLVGCTVSPGFEFDGFELADRESLLSDWPDAKDWIEKLT